MAIIKNDLIVMNGGGADLNIAYGQDAPADTTKLWLKTEEPSGVEYSKSGYNNTYGLETGISALPTTLLGATAEAVNNKVYIFGGIDGTGYTDAIQCYDVETNIITMMSAKLPTARANMGSAIVGTKIYLFGGCRTAYLNTILCYDTETDTITTLSVTLPYSAYEIAVAAVGTKIYTFGGYAGDAGYFDTICCYDTVYNTIITMSATMANKSTGLCAISYGKIIYIFGGYRESGTRHDRIYRYNTETNYYDTVLYHAYAPGVVGVTGVEIGGNIYTFGGATPDRVNLIQRYNPVNNSFITLTTKLPMPAYKIASAAVGTKVYLFGGGSPSGAINTINCFSAYYTLPADLIHIETEYDKNRFDLISTDGITVSAGFSFVLKGVADAAAVEVEAYLHNGTQWVRTI